jgi:hypothetical protein
MVQVCFFTAPFYSMGLVTPQRSERLLAGCEHQVLSVAAVKSYDHPYVNINLMPVIVTGCRGKFEHFHTIRQIPG